MSFKHVLLGLLVVLIWGCNFIFVEWGVTELPPLFLCALRFFMASFPLVFFLKRPNAPFKWIMAYGLLMFGLQFAFMFTGIKVGMTPGLAALVSQVQIFFSLFFAAILLKEMPKIPQILGAAISFFGIGIVIMHLQSASMTLSSFLLIMGASLAWGLGNLITKKLSHVNMMSLVVWGSLVACLPLLLASLMLEGWQSIYTSVQHITWLGISAVLYIVYMSTWLGYAIWNGLIRHYPIATVVPFSLLVPVVAMISSALLLGEALPPWKMIAAVFVIAGLCVNLLSVYFTSKFAALKSPA